MYSPVHDHSYRKPTGGAGVVMGQLVWGGTGGAERNRCCGEGQIVWGAQLLWGGIVGVGRNRWCGEKQVV